MRASHRQSQPWTLPWSCVVLYFAVRGGRWMKCVVLQVFVVIGIFWGGEVGCKVRVVLKYRVHGWMSRLSMSNYSDLERFDWEGWCWRCTAERGKHTGQRYNNCMACGQITNYLVTQCRPLNISSSSGGLGGLGRCAKQVFSGNAPKRLSLFTRKCLNTLHINKSPFDWILAVWGHIMICLLNLSYLEIYLSMQGVEKSHISMPYMQTHHKMESYSWHFWVSAFCDFSFDTFVHIAHRMCSTRGLCRLSDA
jgi:hypothetical protein